MVKFSGVTLLHIHIHIFTLLIDITIPETQHRIYTANSYTSLITTDSVLMPFAVRWKLLSSALLGRDMMTDKD